MFAPCVQVRSLKWTAIRGIVPIIAFSLNMHLLAAAEGPTGEDPVKLFAAFESEWKAREQGRASEAAERLIHLREGARPIIPQLIAFIKDLPEGNKLDGTEYSYRSDAARILASIGAPAAIALPELIAGGDAKVSTKGTSVLLNGTPVMGSKSFTAKEDEFLPWTVAYSRFETIAEAFDCLAFEAVPAVPRLIQLLNSQSVEIRAEACRCLGPIGRLANAALPRIRALCKDPDASCRKEALRAFALIETDETQLVPLLANALADDSETLQLAALEIIPGIGKLAIPLSDQLVALLAHSDLDAKELRGGKERLFVPDLNDLESGKIIQALESMDLQNGKQCDVIAGLLIRDNGQMNEDARSRISTLLVRAGAMGHPALERWVTSTQNADDKTQIAALLAAFTVKPPIAKLVPANIDRTLALYHKLVPQKSSPQNIGGFVEVPPIEMAVHGLLLISPLHRLHLERQKRSGPILAGL